MPSRFLRMTDTSSLTPVWVESDLAVLNYDRLVAGLAATGAESTALLFAQPMTGRESGATQAISWYTSLHGGMVPLTRLEGEERRAAERELGRQLAPLQSVLADSEHGALIRAALSIPSAEDVLVVQGQPVLTNWGFLPPGHAADPAAQAAHWATGLGAFAGFSFPDDTPRRAPPTASGSEAPAPWTDPADPGLPTPRPAWYRSPSGVLALWGAVLLAALVLWLAWTLVWSPRARAMAIVAAVNTGLAEEIDRLKTALDGNACAALPNGVAQPVPPAPRPRPIDGEEKGGHSPPPSNDPLEKVRTSAENSVVFVLAQQKDSLSTGSGFLIGPRTVLTNRHVVEGGGELYITSRSLGRLHQVKVQAISDNPRHDYALLTVVGDLPDKAQPLPLATSVQKLDRIFTAGYPALITEYDPGFAALMNGNNDAAPEVQMNSGVVGSILKDTPPVIVHSAMISQGNSGGPLLNQCGQVVGINTFLRISNEADAGGARENLHQANYALVSTDIAAFLERSGSHPTLVETRCLSDNSSGG